MSKAGISRARFADALLRGFVRREQAEEIVGDLTESYGTSGTRFWIALLRVVARFAWRPTTALLVAAVVGILSNFALSTTAVRRFGFAGSKDYPMLFRSTWFAGKSAILGALAVFALLRYGLRDRSSWLAMLYAGLCTLYVYTLWMPSLRVEFFGCCAVAAAVSLGVDKLRRPALVVGVSLTCWIVTGSALNLMYFRLLRLGQFEQPVLGHEWLGAIVFGISPSVVAMVLSMRLFGYLHRRWTATDTAVAATGE